MQRFALALIAFSCFASEPYYQRDFPSDEFQQRWSRLFDAMEKNAVGIVQGVPLTNGYIMPRQSNEFYYLCGIETPHSYLLLDARDRTVTLFLPPRNARLEAAEGKVISYEDSELAQRITGANKIASTDSMRGEWLGKQAPAAIYTLLSPAEGNSQSRGELVATNASIAADYWDGRVPREAHFAALLKARYPRARVLDLTPLLDELRAIKSPREVALIRRASKIAGLALMEAMKSTRPGLSEYHLDAAARYIFLVNGARLEGYRSITAAGNANIWNMHYYRNLAPLKDGDVVLMDYAPEVGYYTSDIGRMWPVNGKYSPLHRELLGFVVRYHKEVMKRIRPGVTAKQIMDEARAVMEPIHASTKWSKPIYEAAARRLIERGGGVFSHPVGMAVHDDGRYIDGNLKPGHVFAVDPQLWVPEEQIYIRCEDVVAVTETGVENFTEFLPVDLDDVERFLAKREAGVVQKTPPTEKLP
ncbi:MAG TPA: hypothetical protein DEH78_22190 [Solibacterales bacterium]|nr:hypothetical protein [Bryobacterales bacterium]